MAIEKKLLHVEIYVQADDGTNNGVLVKTVDVPADNIRFTAKGGVLSRHSPLQDAVHAALAKRYGAIMNGGFSLVIDGEEINDCHIDQVASDSRFVCFGTRSP